MSFYKRVWIENDPDLQHIRREASAHMGEVESDYPFRLPTRKFVTTPDGKRRQNKWWLFALKRALNESASPIVQINNGCHFRTAEELEHVKGLTEYYLNRPGGLLGRVTPTASREEYLASRFHRLMHGKTDIIEAAKNKAKQQGRDCPQCGYPMKVRTARRGANLGGKFLGCSLFPACKGTREFAG